jgi:hypothetical protein
MTMMKQSTSHAGRRRNRLFLAAIAILGFAALPLGGCDSILEVKDPDIVTPDNLTDELGLTTLRNGALSNFNQAWSGGGWLEGGIVLLSGLMTDEWMHAGTFPTRRQLDRREVQVRGNGTLDNMFLQLQQARADLERAAVRIEASVADPSADDRIPEMLAYAGFTYVAFGENYCSGVPFSETIDSILYGEPLTTTQILEQAVAHFDAAIAHPAASTEIEYLARIGKGRALLSLDRAADAAAAVGAVPDDWVVYNWHSNASPPRSILGTYHLNPEAGRWSVADGEGGTGLAFRAADDPRVPWSDIGFGFDAETPLYQFDVYQERTDRFPLATGVEARLIEAEAALQSGGDWLGILNGLRADFATLGPLLYPDNPPSGTLGVLADPGSAAAREDVLFEERAFWLFNTGHRLGDLRRLIRQYGRGAESVFPNGAYFKGGFYGSDVNIPVPQPEENNPNFAACLDRNP